MKKKVLLIIGIIIVVICIFVVGFLRQQHKMLEEPSSDSNVLEGDLDEESHEKEFEEDNFFEQVEEDASIEKNIFEMGEYQSFGGFGFRVIDFEVFNNYEDMKKCPEYDEDKIDYRPFMFDIPETEYVYLEIEITNESDEETGFMTSKIAVYPLENETFDYIVNGTEKWIVTGGEQAFYVDGVEKAVDDKNDTAPWMQPGETVTLRMFFGNVMTDENSNVIIDDKVHFNHKGIHDILESPEYFVVVEGAWSGGQLGKISEDKLHIYFRIP